MKNIETVRELMSDKLITLHPKDKLRKAKDYFHEYNIHHIPIQVMNDVRGILSLGDILYLEGVVTNSFDRFIQNKKLDTMNVEDVMTKRPYCIEADLLISEALEIMINKHVNALPVTDNDELVGIITTYDIMLFLQKILTT